MTEKTAADRTPEAPVNRPFELYDWLQDANLPHDSADVYKAGLLPAEAATLQRQLEVERGLENVERSAAETDRFVELELRYRDVLAAWAASKITVYVSAIPPEEMRELRKAHDVKTAGMDTSVANEIFGYEILAASIIGVAEVGVSYTDEDGNPALFGPVNWEMRHVRALAKKVGDAQMSHIIAARQTAQNKLPNVDADFLRKSSGEDSKSTDH